MLNEKAGKLCRPQTRKTPCKLFRDRLRRSDHIASNKRIIMATQITKQDFIEYLRVQKSGKTNMFDISVVEAFSGLPRNKILLIMKNYHDYKKRWEPDSVSA